jgi:hypothetical protein
MAKHYHSARFITTFSSDPGMHLVQEKHVEYLEKNRFDVHWDPKSSAFAITSLPYAALGDVGKQIERGVAGLSHNNPKSSAQVREELKKMGIVPRNEP